MATSTIEAGKAFLRLLIENKDFSKGLDDSLRQLKSFGASVTKVGAILGTAGAAITAPFVASLKIFADAGGELDDLSKKTGLTVQSLTELQFAAKLTGTDIDAVAKAAREMQSNGIDPNLIFDYAARIAAIQDPVERAQAAFEVWGKKAGSALLPMLDTLPEVRKRAHELGITWDQDMVEKADRLGDMMDTLKLQLRGVAAAIGTSVSPQISTLLEIISDSLGPVIEWIKQNGELVASVAAMGVALTVLGAVLTTAGVSIVAVTAAIAALATPIGVATLAIGSLGIAVVAITGYFVDWNTEISKVSKSLKEAFAYLQLMNQLGKAFSDPLGAIQDRRDESGASKKPAAPPKEKENDPFGFKFRSKAEESLRSLFGDLKGVFDAFKNGPLPIGERQQRHGLRGFDSVAQKTLDDFEKETRPLLGTFSGRIAGQIFGGGETNSPGQRIAKGVDKLVAVNEQSRKTLEDIDKNTKRSNQFTAGNV